MLFSLWLVVNIAVIWLTLSEVAILGDNNLFAQDGGIAPIFSVMGVFAGLYINWKTQWETENEFYKIRSYSSTDRAAEVYKQLKGHELP